MGNAREYFYPETAAGGFTSADGTIEFYTRVNALIGPEMTVLDFGAGRGGGQAEGAVAYKRKLQTLKGKCGKVIGADIDRIVMTNSALDEAVILGPDGLIPIPDGSVDLIVSDATFEHIANPAQVVEELTRVLRPGGWLCARTPHRWGYIGLGANLVPNRWHSALLHYLQPGRRDIDVFPTTYRMNTRAELHRLFPEARYKHMTYGYFPEPAYFGTSKLLWGLALLAARLTPAPLAPILMIFLQKIR